MGTASTIVRNHGLDPLHPGLVHSLNAGVEIRSIHVAKSIIITVGVIAKMGIHIINVLLGVIQPSRIAI